MAERSPYTHHTVTSAFTSSLRQRACILRKQCAPLFDSAASLYASRERPSFRPYAHQLLAPTPGSRSKAYFCATESSDQSQVAHGCSCETDWSLRLQSTR